MSFLQSIGSRERQIAVLYLAALAVLVLAAWAGIVPGAGERHPGQPWTAHPYRLAMAAVVLPLAVWLGALSARLGAALGGPVAGIGVLAVGGIVTGVALGLAPMVLYPNDQYPVTFMWVMLGAPAGLASWAAATLLRARRPLAT